MIPDQELERLLYPMSLSWLRATLSAAGLEIVPADAFGVICYKVLAVLDEIMPKFPGDVADVVVPFPPGGNYYARTGLINRALHSLRDQGLAKKTDAGWLRVAS